MSCCEDLRRDLGQIKNEISNFNRNGSSREKALGPNESYVTHSQLMAVQQNCLNEIRKLRADLESGGSSSQKGFSKFFNSLQGKSLIGAGLVGLVSAGGGLERQFADLVRNKALSEGLAKQAPNLAREFEQIKSQLGKTTKIATDASKEAANAGKAAATGLSQIAAIATALAAAGIAVAGIKVGEGRTDAIENRLDLSEAALSKILGLLNPIKQSIRRIEADLNKFKNVTNKDLDGLNRDYKIVADKVKNLNDIAAEARSNASKSLTKITALEPKVKNLNDIAAEARSNASKALTEINQTINPKLSKFNDLIAQANSNASKALKEISQTINPRLSKFNDLIAQANSNASKALAELSKSVNPKLKQLNDIAAEARSNASKALSGLNPLNKQVAEANTTAAKANAGATKALADAATALRTKATPGPKGDKGATGEKGPKGDKGATGERGAAGAVGAVGAMGTPGPQGLRGAPGIDGRPGRDGVDGKPGRDGKDGKDGKDVDEKVVADIQTRLSDIQSKVTPLPAVAAAVNKLPDTINNVPNGEAFKSAVANGTCRTLQPGGCMRKEFDGLGSNLNKQNNLLDKINTAMQGFDLGLLGAINNKLGPQIPNGGIAGNLLRMTDFLKDKFDRLWKTFRVDRIISMLTLAASIHNAAMLSRDLAETLVETLESILKAIQGWMPDFLKSPDGDDFDLEELLKAKLEKFLQDLLGAENYISLKATWIRANRILSTAANMLSSIRSMFNAVTEALQTIGGWIALGFNGIQREGLVSDKTWPWMDETPNFRSNQITRFTDKLENLEDAASSIQQLANSSIEFTSEAKELVEESQKLVKLLDEKQKGTTEKEVQEALKSQAALLSDDDLSPGSK